MQAMQVTEEEISIYARHKPARNFWKTQLSSMIGDIEKSNLEVYLKNRYTQAHEGHSYAIKYIRGRFKLLSTKAK